MRLCSTTGCCSVIALDLAASPYIVEYKVSDLGLPTFMSSIQTPLYANFVKGVDKSLICVYDPPLGVAKVGLKHITEQDKADALEKITDFSAQFRHDREQMGAKWWR